MNLLQRLARAWMERLTPPELERPLAVLLRKQLAHQPADLQALAVHPAWQLRWAAGRLAPERLERQAAWELLLSLASDGDEHVRRVAAAGLADQWAAEPARRGQVERLLRGPASAAQPTLLEACRLLWTRHPERVSEALAVLELAADQPPAGAFLDLGRQFLGDALGKPHPELAHDLRQRWAGAASRALRYHASWAGAQSVPPTEALVASLDAGPDIPVDWRRTTDIPLTGDPGERIAGRPETLLALRRVATGRLPLLLIGGRLEDRRALTEVLAALLPARADDILAHADPLKPSRPRLERVPAGTGQASVAHTAARQERSARRRRLAAFALVSLPVLLTLTWALVASLPWTLAGFLLVALSLVGARRIPGRQPPPAPLVLHAAEGRRAPLVEAGQLTDAALLGDVLPRGELAAHQRLRCGAVHAAHHGVLWFEGMAQRSPAVQRQLLSILQRGEAELRGREIANSLIETLPLACDVLPVFTGDAAEEERLEPALRAWIRTRGQVVVLTDTVLDTPRHRRELSRTIARLAADASPVLPWERAAVELLVDAAARRAGPGGRLDTGCAFLQRILEAARQRALTSRSDVVTAGHCQQALEGAPLAPSIKSA